MTDLQLSALLIELLTLPHETEWVEWKHNYSEPEKIAERISAIANSTALHGHETGYFIWGIEDQTKLILGTSFKPLQAKKGNEELQNWLMRSLHPQVAFKIHEWKHQDKQMVMFEIPRTTHQPVRYDNEAFIRIGSLTKKLKDYPAKEAELWAVFSRKPFETGIAKADLAGPDVLQLIDYDRCLKLLNLMLPGNQQGILNKLAAESLIVAKPGDRFDITNLGAMLFATNLAAFDRLARKALRIIKYKDYGRTDTEREWRDAPASMGYAVAFEPAVAFINSQLPQNEPIGQAFSQEVRVYPEKAIRELVANCLIHQDFNITGTGPVIEIFSNRMEITNPGEPLIDPLRFIDSPPKSRNQDLAALMRRIKLCEEAGSGIDKVVALAEKFQLPAPDFVTVTTTQPGSTKVTLYAPRGLAEMDSHERIRACYQHACLQVVSGSRMTNASLRKRFGIEVQNAAKASRIIYDATEAGLIKPFDPDQGKKYASYVPFWS